MWTSRSLTAVLVLLAATAALAQDPPPEGICAWATKQAQSKTQAGVGISRPPWTDGIIPFAIDTTISDDTREKTLSALEAWEVDTPLEFIPHNGEQAYLVFTDSGNSPSSSAVGMGGRRQFVFIAQPATRGNIIHEIGHAIGLHHEHQRSDRDRYVVIHEENLTLGIFRSQVAAVLPTLNYTAYDFGSIMHYPANALTRNGGNTIVPREAYGEFLAAIGQRDDPSELDRLGITRLYSHIPVLLSPPDGAIRIPAGGIAVEWSNLPSAAAYQIELSESATFERTSMKMEVPAEVVDTRPIIRGQSVETGPLRMGATYHWRVRVLTEEGAQGWSNSRDFTVISPSASRLYPSYPNPFRTSTTIVFDLDFGGAVSVAIFDAAGRRVVNLVDGFVPAGRHTVEWSPTALATGEYFVLMTAPDYSGSSVLTLSR